MIVPPYIITMLEDLNRHAKTRGILGTEHNAIYRYKDYVALTLALTRACPVRPVKWTGKCNLCDNGIYTHWSNERLKCRHCSGTGSVTLRFAETTLPSGNAWHHPVYRSDGYGAQILHAYFGSNSTGGSGDNKWPTFDSNLLSWEDAGDWAPNQPGTRLLPIIVIGTLNAVEEWLLSLPEIPRGAAFWYVQETALRAIWGYRLDIGALEKRCVVCGVTEGVQRLGHLSERLHWSSYACDEHKKEAHGRRDPPPELVCTHLREWLDRRTTRDSKLRLESVGEETPF